MKGCGGRFTILAAWALLIALISPVARADEDAAPVDEAQLKADFVVRLLKFVDWPAGATRRGEPLKVCILGEDPFDGKLQSVAYPTGRVAGYDVIRSSDVKVAAGCHLVFVAESEKEGLDTILRGLQFSHALTVSDIQGFADSGGMIEVFMSGPKLRFTINLAATQRAGPKLSYKLLKLAVGVKNFDAGESAP